MGVRAQLLDLAFTTEHRVALQPGSCMADPAIEEFRRISYFYNSCIKNYKVWYDGRVFARKAMPYFSAECGIAKVGVLRDLIKVRGDTEFSVFLNRMLTRREELLDSVIAKLELGLPVELARKVMSIPYVTPQSCLQHNWFLTVVRTEDTYGFVTGIECIDYDHRQMFSTDVALYNRLSLLTASPLGSVPTDTKFHKEVQAYLDAVYLSPLMLKDWDKLYALADDQGTLGLELGQYVTCSNNNALPVEIIRGTPLEELPEGKKLVIVAIADQAEQLAVKYPEIDFGVLPPLDSRKFVLWSNRRLPNIYLMRKYAI